MEEQETQKDKEQKIDTNKISNNWFMNYFYPKQHCPFCKKRIIENPLFIIDKSTGEYKQPLVRDKSKKKGWFVMPWYVVVILLLVISFSYVYVHDMKQVLDINKDPCTFVEKNMQYCIDQKAIKDNPYGVVEIPAGINR